MNFISNFKPLDDLDGYDKEVNPNRLSVIDLLPYGVTWLSDGGIYEIKHCDKIIPLLLRSNAEIALIKSPFKKDDNNAYIITSSNEIKWDIGSMITNHRSIMVFSDVYYISDELYFFVHIDGKDYRFSFDPNAGKVGDFIPSF